MFGFSSFTVQLFQGSIERTWHCVSQFTHLIWQKLHYKHQIMPRSRRRHHSRSRTRSRSHSHERDRDIKRRKVEIDSPTHKRSVSCEQQVNVTTPNKSLTPKQQKRLESEKKRAQKQLERDERFKEKERIRLEKEEIKTKKNEEKAKEKELKEEQRRKEREEKDAKKREKEEVKTIEKMKKQHEFEEKNREKQKLEEKKQKAAQAFANFFVAKKADQAKDDTEEVTTKTMKFMPFEIKSDMRMAPIVRKQLDGEKKFFLINSINKEESSMYLNNLKKDRIFGKYGKTWPYQDDEVVVIEDDFGDSICDTKKVHQLRVKFLKFHENRRPAFYGTWRKKSNIINGRKPFFEDKNFFNYEVDSDDDWEEEEQGESLNGSDDDEKENEAENDDYEVDNEFFVPHGHLSDDEVDEEETSKLSPESHKQKLKLLKDEFDIDMLAKTNRMKPRSIGCVWYKKNSSNIEEIIDRQLQPLAMINDGQMIIVNRQGEEKEILPSEIIPIFLKIIDGNINNKKKMIDEFLSYLKNNGHFHDFKRSMITKCLKEFAQWKKCSKEGPMLNKFCWCIHDEIKKKYLAV